MRVLEPLDTAVLEPLARALSKAATGSQLTGLMKQVGLTDNVGEGATKWKRVHAAIASDQASYKQANRTLAFVKVVLAPPRFAHNRDQFESLGEEVNRLLAFCGFHLYEAGRLGTIERAKTVSQAQERASRLRSELLTRNVHADVLRFCKEELVVPNYFHAVFEATKSVAEKLRAKSGLASDGVELVDAALGLGNSALPMLAFNSLQSETERSEHKGFAMLLKGMFGAFRNVTAHAPPSQRLATERVEKAGPESREQHRGSTPGFAEESFPQEPAAWLARAGLRQHPEHRRKAVGASTPKVVDAPRDRRRQVAWANACRAASIVRSRECDPPACSPRKIRYRTASSGESAIQIAWRESATGRPSWIE